MSEGEVLTDEDYAAVDDAPTDELVEVDETPLGRRTTNLAAEHRVTTPPPFPGGGAFVVPQLIEGLDPYFPTPLVSNHGDWILLLHEPTFPQTSSPAFAVDGLRGRSAAPAVRAAAPSMAVKECLVFMVLIS
ncbi:hypothetical protein GSY69_08460 [Brevibacterium sp. 5221]|uniref:Uncharacterized protein n=1 Tax=Brevibacterium rongguiense TaxID=2695267 RepID=A0A6N9H8W1_9MICO|nr:hypothetical protein [Brevibacterium rongguiense]MYM19994.1 hypothetical protein [Brevibacterium rongguiense]